MAQLKITVNDVAHVNVFIQEGAYAAITGPQDCLAEMLAEDDRRRRLVVERMNAMKNVSCGLPEGTIYAFPDVGGVGKSSSEIANELLDQAHVVVLRFSTQMSQQRRRKFESDRHRPVTDRAKPPVEPRDLHKGLWPHSISLCGNH